MFNITRLVVYSTYLDRRTACFRLCAMRLSTYHRNRNTGLKNFRKPQKRHPCTSTKTCTEKPRQNPTDRDDIKSLGVNKAGTNVYFIYMTLIFKRIMGGGGGKY
jgi:hypothetical protein